MKYRAKQNEVNKNCRCLSVGYCDLQNELSILEPNAYTAVVYGWNADLYELPYNYVVVTGLRPFGKTRLKLTAEEKTQIREIKQNWLDRSIDKLCAEYLTKEVLLTACQRCWYGGQ